MALVTVATLKTRILQRADMEFSASVSDTEKYVKSAELIDLIDVSYKELYGYIARYSPRRPESEFSVTATGVATYSLASPDPLLILAVFRIDDSGINFYLTKHDHRLKPSLSITGDAISYRLSGNNIEFYPVPTSGTYKGIYVPKPSTLDDDADTLDGVNGWEEYIVCDVAAKLKRKEDSDPTVELLERDRILKRILDEARDMEMSESMVVQDVRHNINSTLPGGNFDYRPYYFFF